MNRDRKDILDSPGTLNRRERAAARLPALAGSSSDIRKKTRVYFRDEARRKRWRNEDKRTIYGKLEKKGALAGAQEHFVGQVLRN